MKTTKQHTDYWKNRKIDWAASYLSTWNHPHRELLMMALSSFPWISLWEVGCGPGANLVKLLKNGAGGKQLGGSDVNADAIELARKTFKGGKFHVEPADNLLLSDESVDVILSDATLIYYGPTKIDKALKEMARVARNHIVLCELHSNNWFARQWMRLKRGYNVYDYKARLEKAGCFDIKIAKIPADFWPGTPWEDYGYIIIARITHI